MVVVGMQFYFVLRATTIVIIITVHNNISMILVRLLELLAVLSCQKMITIIKFGKTKISWDKNKVPCLKKLKYMSYYFLVFYLLLGFQLYLRQVKKVQLQ